MELLLLRPSVGCNSTIAITHILKGGNKMKCKAPETLLEFSDYLHTFSCKWLKSITSSSTSHGDNDCESCSPPSLQLVPDGFSDVDAALGSPPTGSNEFDISTITSRNFHAYKPTNCQTPHQTLVLALKWIVAHKNIMQKDISDAVGVR